MVALTSLLLFMCGVSSAVVALTSLLLFMCGVSSAVVALTSCDLCRELLGLAFN